MTMMQKQARKVNLVDYVRNYNTFELNLDCAPPHSVL